MTNKTKAVIFMLLSAFTFALMSVFIRLAGDIPPVEKVLFRTVFASVVLFFIIKKKKLSLFGKKWNQKLLIFRSIFGLLGIVLYFYGINYVYLADAAMLSRLNPFFLTFFAWLFLKEKLNTYQLVALLIVFFASLLIIKPKLSSEFIPALAIATAAALTGASHTIVRALHFKEHPITIVFYFSFASSIFIIPFVAFSFVLPSGLQLLYLLGIAIAGVLSQIFLTYAFSLALASEITIYSYSTIIFGALLGFIFWYEISDTYSMIGGVIIIVVSILLFLKQKKLSNKEIAKKQNNTKE